MLLIIYIPVTRVRESGRRSRVGGGNAIDGEQEGDLWYPRSGEPRSGNPPRSPLCSTLSRLSPSLSRSLRLSLSPPLSLSLSLSFSTRTVPSAQKTRRFIAKERRENVDLSSYVPAWQFVCPRTLSAERGYRVSEGVAE